MHKRNHGFTIVELLIVIIVIGILATVTLIAYNDIQDQARLAKARSDVKQLSTALDLARSATGKTFSQLTGNTVSDEPCVNQPSGTDLAKLSRSDPCWTNYLNALQIIQDASGAGVKDLVDPWGRPYMIDENEGVNGPCYQDTISMYPHPFTFSSPPWVPDARMPNENIMLSGYTGCKTPTPH